MKSARRAPDAPVPDLLEGRCPLCDGKGGNGPLADCHICDGFGRVLYSAVWSDREDAKLREIIEAGRSPNYAAVDLRRPIALVHARIALLGIKSPRPEPAPFFSVHVRGSDELVDVHDPIGHDQAVRP